MHICFQFINIINDPKNVPMNSLCELLSTIIAIGFLLYLNEKKLTLSEFKPKHFNKFMQKLNKQLQKKLIKWQNKYK